MTNLTTILLLFSIIVMNAVEKRSISMRLSKKVVLVFALALIVAGLAIFFGWQLLRSDQDTETQSEETATAIVNTVGQFYDLPTSEEPTVAQIQDRAKIADQEFFNKAQNGDYVIVYESSKLALIYRESIKKLINVGTISIGSSDDSSSDTESSP